MMSDISMVGVAGPLSATSKPTAVTFCALPVLGEQS
jgi:hypothetical protein